MSYPLNRRKCRTWGKWWFLMFPYSCAGSLPSFIVRQAVKIALPPTLLFFPKPGRDRRACGCFILTIIIITLFPRWGETSENSWHRPCPAALALRQPERPSPLLGDPRGEHKPVGSPPPTLLVQSLQRKGKNTNLKLPQELMSIKAAGSCADVGHYSFKHGL